MKPLLDEIAEAIYSDGYTDNLHDREDFVIEEYKRYAQAEIDVVERRLLSEAESQGTLNYFVVNEAWKAVKDGDYLVPQPVWNGVPASPQPTLKYVDHFTGNPPRGDKC